jgi:hypothetical protein
MQEGEAAPALPISVTWAGGSKEVAYDGKRITAAGFLAQHFPGAGARLRVGSHELADNECFGDFYGITSASKVTLVTSSALTSTSASTSASRNFVGSNGGLPGLPRTPYNLKFSNGDIVKDGQLLPSQRDQVPALDEVEATALDLQEMQARSVHLSEFEMGNINKPKVIGVVHLGGVNKNPTMLLRSLSGDGNRLAGTMDVVSGTLDSIGLGRDQRDWDKEGLACAWCRRSTALLPAAHRRSRRSSAGRTPRPSSCSSWRTPLMPSTPSERGAASHALRRGSDSCPRSTVLRPGASAATSFSAIRGRTRISVAIPSRTRWTRTGPSSATAKSTSCSSCNNSGSSS